MKTIITPVGTSLFENCRERHREIDSYFRQVKKSRLADWASCERTIARLRETGIKYINQQGDTASAEIQSIKAIQRELQEEVQVRLLASDTITSVLAAEILSDKVIVPVFGDKIKVDFDRHLDRIGGLQVHDEKEFIREGMPNLIQRIRQINPNLGIYTGAREANLAFDITGGYKATLPYLTILGQVWRIPLYYVFEDTDTPIKIPQAPINIDWGVMARYSQLLAQIDDEGINDWQTFQQEHYQAVEDLDACIQVCDNIATLSPIGEIFWAIYQNFYLVKIHEETYSVYKREKTADIDEAIQKLYSRLNEALSENKAFREPECFKVIYSLPQNNNLNHGGPINEFSFIFKTSEEHVHTRFAYSFRANGRELTSITIFEILHGEFNHSSYIKRFKEKYNNPSDLDFVTLTFPKPNR